MVIDPIDADTDWTDALHDVHTVIHLAARAHVLDETAVEPLETFRQVNAIGTKCLAEAAATAGVSRMVYASTIGVHGTTTGAQPFTEQSPVQPATPYAQSKYEGEEALREIASESELDFVIVRPPLIHGPGVKGNFLRLLRWVDRRVPLPLATIDNRRSLLGLDNAVDLLVQCALSERAAGQTFVATDGEDVSTPELLRRIGRGLGRAPRLFPCPERLMRLAARAIGRGDDVDRLFGSLQVDDRHVRETLDWTPPTSLDAGLDAMCRWYKNQR